MASLSRIVLFWNHVLKHNTDNYDVLDGLEATEDTAPNEPDKLDVLDEADLPQMQLSWHFRPLVRFLRLRSR